MDPIRLVVADDSALLRESVALTLKARGFDVVATCGDGTTALQLVEKHRPDVAVLDIRMPPSGSGEGLAVATRIGEAVPETSVLLLSDYLEPAYARALLADQMPGRGYLLKQSAATLEVLFEAVQRVASGESVIDSAIVERLMNRVRQGNPLDALTEREREVLAMMAEGRTNVAIAQRLVLSERTVEGNVRRILTKLGMPEGPEDHRRVLAVLAYLRV